jgi:uncharacterized membrane protein
MTSFKTLKGWDITLFNKQYFFSKMKFNVITTIISIPYLLNAISTFKHIKENKEKNGGRLKMTPGDAVRLFGIDFVLLTVGLVGYVFLKQKGGLIVVARHSKL